MAIGHIIKDNLEYINLTQKQLSQLTGISEADISNIISNKKLIDAEISSKLGPVIGLSEMSLLNYQNNLIESKKTETWEEKIIYDYMESNLDKFKLASRGTIKKYAKNIFSTPSLDNYKNYISESATSFRMYKNKPLAYLWIALMEKKYCKKNSDGEFKMSLKNTIYKNVLEIVFSDNKFELKNTLLKSYLSQKGIILENGPFIPDSTIYGVSLKRGTQWFIFLSDMKKREYSYCYSLIHELVHIFEQIKDEEEKVDEIATEIIKKYSSKSKTQNAELLLFLETKEKFSNDEENNNQLADELYKKTKFKISFGEVKELFDIVASL